MNLLLISNSKASSDNPNGKTILNFAQCFPDVHLFNFFCNFSESRNENGVSYFGFSDNELISLGRKGKSSSGSITLSEKKTRKTAWTQLIRYWAWTLLPWQSKGFKKWLSDAHIDSVLIYVGDAPYLLKLGTSIAKKYRCPLYLFTGENYAFKSFDYMAKKTKIGLGYWLFDHLLLARTKTTYKLAKASFFNSEPLLDEYKKQLNIRNGYVAYPISRKIPIIKRPKEVSSIVYGGGFGLDRYKGICEIADVCFRINPAVKIHIYGNGDEIGKKELESRPNILLHGTIPADELDSKIQKADLLIHCETFDDYYIEDLKFAFSTKIVESLMSGTPFFLYAPSSLAGTRYCKEIVGEYVCSSRRELSERLPIILGGLDYPLPAQKLLARHSPEFLRRLLTSVCENAD